MDTLRSRSRRGWLTFIILAGIGTAMVGRFWLFHLATCPNLQFALLYFATTVAVIAMTIKAIFSRDDSPITQLKTIGFVVVAGLLIPAVAGPLLAGFSDVKAVYCPSCDDVVKIAKELREKGEISGAETLARRCFEEAMDEQAKAAAARELAYALYDEGGQFIEERQCKDVVTVLDEAHNLATQYWQNDLIEAIEERTRNYHLVCDPAPTPGPTYTPTMTPTRTPTLTPTPTTTPFPTPRLVQLEILRTQVTDEKAIIDFTAKRGGQMVDLQRSDVAIRLESKSIPITYFERRSTDDPVCLVLVIDNSGTVKDGLDEIKESVRILNDSRKPGDELGLVIFDKTIVSTRNPTANALGQSELNSWLNPLNAEGSQTAVWDAMTKGIEIASGCGKGTLRYLVVLTDGDNNWDLETAKPDPTDPKDGAEQIAKVAEAENIGTCMIGVPSREGRYKEEALEKAVYGCSYERAMEGNWDYLVSIFREKIFGYVRDFYRLEFSPDVITASPTVIVLHVWDALTTISFTK